MRLLAAAATTVLLAACAGTTAAVRHGSPSAAPSPSPASSPSGPEETLISMRMTSVSVMWAATETRVLRSADAGRSWNDVTPADRPGGWSAFFALDDSFAWSVHSDYGTKSLTVERTADGGRTWSHSAAPTPGGGATVATFVDHLHGWLYVDLGFAAGSQGVAIIRTIDGGATWAVAAHTDDPTSGPGTSGLSFGCDKGGVSFGSAAVGLLPTECAGGLPYIYRSTDGGSHWTSVGLPELGSTELAVYFLAPTFLDANNAVTVGTYYVGVDEPVTGLLATQNAGTTWSVSRLPGRGSIDFESPLSGWQMNETLSATSDGGRSWRTIGALPFTGLDMRLQYLGRGVAIAWTIRSTSAYRTDDGGRTWRPVAPAGLHS